MRRFWQAMYGAGLLAQSLLALVAALPGLLLLSTVIGFRGATLQHVVIGTIVWAPVLAGMFFISYAILVALAFRAVSHLLRPGWHSDEGAASWAIWLSGTLMEGAVGVLFPLYASVFTRSWLRLCGLSVGKRTEMSHAVTLTRLATLGDTSFSADDVVFAVNRVRGGWLHLAPIEVGSRTFLGNSATLKQSTKVGHDSLVGVFTTAPVVSADGTSWFGAPALELPRVREHADPSRTISPPPRLVVGRGATEVVRILLPSSVSLVLGVLSFWAINAIGAAGPWAMAAVAPFVLLSAAFGAVILTVALKWLIIGRYRPGEHPLWSFFVWRDEIMNSAQEQLAGAWLMKSAFATPLMSAYLRAMGSKVGKGVCCETLNLTEFDIVHLGDGCAINRQVHVETHLFHDRIMQIGPTTIGSGATLAPMSAVLPDTTIGASTCLGARSVVLRGEELPPGTRWHGAPVVAA